MTYCSSDKRAILEISPISPHKNNVTFSFDICSKFVWVGAIWWALGGIYIFITSLDTVTALWDTYHCWTHKISKQTHASNTRSPESGSSSVWHSVPGSQLSAGQTKKTTFHLLISVEEVEGEEYRLYITEIGPAQSLSSQSSLFSGSTIENVAGLLVPLHPGHQDWRDSGPPVDIGGAAGSSS